MKRLCLFILTALLITGCTTSQTKEESTPTPKPDIQNTSSETLATTPTPVPSPTPSPSSELTPTPTAEATSTPSATPKPTASSTVKATPTPTPEDDDWGASTDRLHDGTYGNGLATGCAFNYEAALSIGLIGNTGMVFSTMEEAVAWLEAEIVNSNSQWYGRSGFASSINMPGCYGPNDTVGYTVDFWESTSTPASTPEVQNTPTPTATPEVHEHDYKLMSSVEPQIGVEGTRIYTCSCGESYKETVAALPQPTPESTPILTCEVCGSTEHTTHPLESETPTPEEMTPVETPEVPVEVDGNE